MQPVASTYYAAPQYPQYASAAAAAQPLYASATSTSGVHSQQDALAGVKVRCKLPDPQERSLRLQQVFASCLVSGQLDRQLLGKANDNPLLRS